MKQAFLSQEHPGKEKECQQKAPELYKLHPDVISGKVTLCKNCGCYSEDFEKCCSKTVIANLILPLLIPKSEIDSEFGNYCKMCKQNFTGKLNLQRHIVSAHMNIMYSCTECDEKFTSESGTFLVPKSAILITILHFHVKNLFNFFFCSFGNALPSKTPSIFR